MESETNPMIEKMSVSEIRKFVEELNDKNRILETHLNLMKKCFRVVIQFNTFLESLCHKLNNFVTEEESKQLSDFQSQLAQIYQGQITTSILMDAMGESSKALSPRESSTKRSKSEHKSTKKSPLLICAEEDCYQLFQTQTQLKTHQKECQNSSIKTIDISSEEELKHSTDLKGRNADKSINKKKSLKKKNKINVKTNTSTQTPFSSALMSLAVESKSKSFDNNSINGQKTFVCNYGECQQKGNSLMEIFDHKMTAHLANSSVNNSEDKSEERNTLNEELIVSHNTDSNESFGEWMDSTNDSYFKCSENSCGQLFPENSDLLRHVEVNHSSDVIIVDSEDHFQPKTEPGLVDHDFKMAEMNDSNIISMDPFLGQVSDPLAENNESIALNSNSLLKCCEDLCEMIFEEDRDLIIHMKAVHNKKVKKCTFNGCPFIYENRSLLWTHLKECHKDQQKPFKCSHTPCNNAFLTEADLNRHITSFHAIDRHSSISGIFISDTLSNCQSVKRKKF